MGIADQIIIGIVGLLVGTLLGNEISRFLYRPKVIIKFKKVSPLYSKDGFFLSLVVANYGRTSATNCVGTITLNDLVKEDIMEQNEAVIDEALPRYEDEKNDLDFPRHQLITPDKFREIKNNSICWSKLGNPYQIDINPGMSQALDVCRAQRNIEKDFWYLIFPSEAGWRKIRLRIRMTYLTGRILVCPSNEFPTILDFKIITRINGAPTFLPTRYFIVKRLIRFLNRKKLYFE